MYLLHVAVDLGPHNGLLLQGLEGEGWKGRVGRRGCVGGCMGGCVGGCVGGLEGEGVWEGWKERVCGRVGRRGCVGGLEGVVCGRVGQRGCVGGLEGEGVWEGVGRVCGRVCGRERELMQPH